MDSWILRETDTYALFPPSSVSCTNQRNYGCFKYFRRNLSPLFTTSNKDRSGAYSEMVGGTCCKQLLLNRKKGQQRKVTLYAEESWAQSAASTYWIITPSYWRRNGCNIVEVSGNRKNKGKGEIVYCSSGSLLIAGTFDKIANSPDFKLSLSTDMGQTEFHMGYSMIGTLERGWSALNKFETTHFAVVKKQWPDSSFNAKAAGFKLL